MNYRQPYYVTPSLPPAALALAEEWRHKNKPVFVLAMDLEYPKQCRNCGGGGRLYLRLIDSGPFPSPPPHKVITWFDGDDVFGKGWYVVEDTVGYPCPACSQEEKKVFGKG